MINEAESAALMGLSLLAKTLYVIGLRCFVDYATGVVGVRRRISRQYLREVAEYVPDSGSTRKAWQPSNGEIRAALEELGRAGVIARVPRYQRALVFSLPLVIRRHSVQKRSNRGTTDEEPTPSDAKNILDISELAGFGEAGTTDQNDNNGARNALPLLNNSTPPTRARVRERFAMSHDWLPSPQILDMHLIMQGLKAIAEEEKGEILGEFRSYWLTQPERRTDAEWTHTLVRSIKRHQTEKASGGTRHAASGGARKQPTGSQSVPPANTETQYPHHERAPDETAVDGYAGNVR